MREILFRGKRVDNGEWVYGYYWIGANGFHYIKSVTFYDKDTSDYYIEDFYCEGESVGQFTGLIDKNGLKIFEGDIVREPYGYDGLAWNNYEVTFGAMPDTRIGWFLKGYSAVNNKELFGRLEVVGNTYENIID